MHLHEELKSQVVVLLLKCHVCCTKYICSSEEGYHDLLYYCNGLKCPLQILMLVVMDGAGGPRGRNVHVREGW